MNRGEQRDYRVLAIAPSTRGFGFAVLDTEKTFLDWAGRSVKGDKNGESLKKIKQLIDQYMPKVIVLPDASAKCSRRSPRIRVLCQQIAKAAGQEVRIALFSPLQVRQSFFALGQGTKHDIAEAITKEFPEELGTRLPPKRQPWMSEDHRMDIFDAVALALVYLRRRQR